MNYRFAMAISSVALWTGLCLYEETAAIDRSVGRTQITRTIRVPGRRGQEEEFPDPQGPPPWLNDPEMPE